MKGSIRDRTSVAIPACPRTAQRVPSWIDGMDSACQGKATRVMVGARMDWPASLDVLDGHGALAAIQPAFDPARLRGVQVLHLPLPHRELLPLRRLLRGHVGLLCG